MIVLDNKRKEGDQGSYQANPDYQAEGHFEATEAPSTEESASVPAEDSEAEDKKEKVKAEPKAEAEAKTEEKPQPKADEGKTDEKVNPDDIPF